ncbi:hypothetical protein BDV96DRAFT_586140 [Lophiotrema nucula]|uniref:Uncharacterized protein n=1 Tax=Lophiotrema nucula TaxID=690887 RepID=A0A6A5YPW3_9PLEO|nr:hypothetical protein BDV96DRAFT_586140 [Lophiotrema nucula]
MLRSGGIALLAGSVKVTESEDVGNAMDGGLSVGVLMPSEDWKLLLKGGALRPSTDPTKSPKPSTDVADSGKAVTDGIVGLESITEAPSISTVGIFKEVLRPSRDPMKSPKPPIVLVDKWGSDTDNSVGPGGTDNAGVDKMLGIDIDGTVGPLGIDIEDGL